MLGETRDVVTVLLSGPVLSAVSGVGTHLTQLFGSSLAGSFRLEHFQVGSEGRQEKWPQKLIRLMLSPWALVYVVLRRRADIVHLNTSLDQKGFWRDAGYLVIAKLLRRAVVYQVHGGVLPARLFRRGKSLTRLLKWVLTLPDAVVLLAAVEARGYRSFANIRRLYIIPNAVDLTEFETHPAKDFHRPEINLVYIGRLIASKGIYEAIEAIALLSGPMGLPSVRLTVAGSGPEERRVQQRARSLGLSDRIRFVGAVFGAEKQRLWRAAGLCLFPTFHDEGLPYTVLESLASGTPLITTRVGGIPEAMQDGVHGIFVEPHDAQGVAEAVASLLQDRPRLRSMSQACVVRARECFSIERLVRQLSELYHDVLSPT